MAGRTPRPRSKPLVARSTLVACVILGIISGSLPAAAQAPQKVFRVGHLAAPGRTPDGAPPRPLREALRGLGYVEGQNIAYEARFAEAKFERLPELAAELVRLKVDVIVAQGGQQSKQRGEQARPSRSSSRSPLGTPSRSGGSRPSRAQVETSPA